MKRIAAVAASLLLLLILAACSPYDADMVIIVQNGTTAPVVTPAETTPAETTPAETTPITTAPVSTTPAETVPAGTTPVETTPARTTPVETTPAGTTPAETTGAPMDWSSTHFIVNTNTKKFHVSTCRYADQIKAENRKEVVGTAEFTEEYTPCKVCLPDFTLEQ